MSDLIDRQMLKADLLCGDDAEHDYCFPCRRILERIDNQSAVQPERKKGAWINEGRIIRCNRCKIGYATVKGMKSALTYKFCPNCGSDMREGEQNDEQASTNND